MPFFLIWRRVFSFLLLGDALYLRAMPFFSLFPFGDAFFFRKLKIIGISGLGCPYLVAEKMNVLKRSPLILITCRRFCVEFQVLVFITYIPLFTMAGVIESGPSTSDWASLPRDVLQTIGGKLKGLALRAIEDAEAAEARSLLDDEDGDPVDIPSLSSELAGCRLACSNWSRDLFVGPSDLYGNKALPSWGSALLTDLRSITLKYDGSLGHFGPGIVQDCPDPGVSVPETAFRSLEKMTLLTPSEASDGSRILQSLVPHGRIRQLVIHCAVFFTERQLADIGRLPSLTLLDLDMPFHFTDDSARALAGLTALSSLVIHRPEEGFTDEGFVALCGLPSLTSLSVTGAYFAFTRDVCEALSGLTGLASLKISRWDSGSFDRDLPEAAVRAVASLTSLTMLAVDVAVPAARECIEPLLGLVGLTSLNMRFRVSGADSSVLQSLTALRALEEVKLSVDGSIDSALFALAKLPALKIIAVSSTARSSFPALEALRGLFRLRLAPGEDVSLPILRLHPDPFPRSY